MKYPLLFLSILLILVSCKAPELIPEVTDHLIVKKIDLPGKIKSPLILGSDSNLLIAGRNGKIWGYDPVTGNAELINDTKTRIRRIIYKNPNYTAIKCIAPGKILIFDQKKRKHFQLDNFRGKILFIEGETLVYSLMGKIIAFDFKAGKKINSISLNSETVFGAAFDGENILIISEEILYRFSIERKEFTQTLLPLKATSGFALTGNSIYFSTRERKFCKFNHIKNKLSWKIDIQAKNSRPVIRFKKFLVLTPHDNSIYFFTKSGTLFWWKKTGMEILTILAYMNDHIVLLARDGETELLLFLNPEKRIVRKLILENENLYFPGTCLNGKIYAGGIDTGDRTEGIYSSGNRRGGIIKIAKKKKFDLNRSIKIVVEPVNMIKPKIDVSITDSAGDTKLIQNFFSKLPVNIAWVPSIPGKYFINVSLTGKFNKITEERLEIEIFDFKKFFKDYYLQVLKKCMNGQF